MKRAERQEVRAFWEEAPCGTRELLSREEEARWTELERARYEREPFIFPLAGFEQARGQRVLEVGCGAGTDLLQFARRGARVVGLDLTQAGAAMATRRLRHEKLDGVVLRGDAEKLPFPDATFDVVYSWGVIHHTERTEDAARDILRVLRPGGRFVVMVYNARSLVAFQTWAVYGLLRGRPGASARELIAAHVESPGTKAYTAAEARALFAGAAEAAVETVVTPYDVRLWSRRTFLPAPLRKLVPSGLGWFHVVRGRR